MALNIKNPEVERLVAEVVRITGESKTEAIRRALAERHRRLRLARPERVQRERVQEFLANEVWTRVPDAQRRKAPTKPEREAILGYDPEGV